jgi:putative nucleotidyltransferase with HDIG domain
MENSRKKIPISLLRPGMYVEEVYNENNLLLFSVDALVSGFYQIESLKKQGVSFLFVNVKKSNEVVKQIEEYAFEDENDISNTNRIVIEDAQDQLIEYQNKLKEALSVRQRTVFAVKNLMNDAKTGKTFSLQAVSASVEEIIDQVLEDPDVFMRICQLKKHSYNTYVHSVNVSVLMAGFASTLGFSKDKTFELTIGGILHDIGKTRVPEQLLQKDGVYTMQEMELIRRHPAIGVDILKKMPVKIPEITFNIVEQHHERLNGSGYPQKLRGKQINEQALMCAITDVYDTLTSDTGYRRRCLPQEALAIIFQGADEEYPRTMVEYFTKMIGIYPVGSFVRLSSKEMGVVVKVNRNSLLYPQVMVLFDSNSQKLQSPFIRNLSESDNKDEWKVECTLNPDNYHIDMDEFVNVV